MQVGLAVVARGAVLHLEGGDHVAGGLIQLAVLRHRVADAGQLVLEPGGARHLAVELAQPFLHRGGLWPGNQPGGAEPPLKNLALVANS